MHGVDQFADGVDFRGIPVGHPPPGRASDGNTNPLALLSINTQIFHDELVKFRKLLFSSQLFDDLSVYYDGESVS